MKKQRGNTMKGNKNRFAGLRVGFSLLILVLAGSTTVMAQETIKLSDEQVDNLVKRSYQYVAMFNVIQKFAQDPISDAMFTDGLNKPVSATTLADHTMKSIARPNNDTLYSMAVLDLRKEPVIIEYPAIDSKFVCLETSAYDHYCDIPMSTTKGDFKKPTKILYYTARTKDYSGEPVKVVAKNIVNTVAKILSIPASRFKIKPMQNFNIFSIPAINYLRLRNRVRSILRVDPSRRLQDELLIQATHLPLFP